ncbi:hypothetical protein SteCoe_9316 [Stentor coeruleus]|uniref:Uncharacterized protein n=1 Tax=Stentor coeruleus TaxID=5963 RepID=A0A1R2CIC1_9CILI|nr:hypothetical protein SteCoe_9316 [Stentor coeruleus]
MRHSERIKDIKNKYSNRIDNSVPRTRRNNSSTKFLRLEKKSQIHKNNVKLLNSIAEISKGKRASSTQLILNSIESLPKPKSLNVQSRRHEAQRIITDNESMARRLCNSSGLSFKKLDKEWHNTVKYKKTISKAKFRTLPGLTQTSRIDSRRSTQDKILAKKRTHSLHENYLINTISSRDIQVSPLISTPCSEIVCIEQHKPFTEFVITGQGRINQNSKFNKVKINPPKPSVRLAPLKKLNV